MTTIFGKFDNGAKDVDPDLRFMALQDLQRYLAGTAAVEEPRQFVAPLLLLLEDTHSDVQNQAVLLCGALARHLGDEETLRFVTELHERALAPQEVLFSRSVHSLALKCVLETPERFHRALARRVFEALAARLGPAAGGDAAEVLLDVLRLVGPHVLDAELTALVTAYAGVAGGGGVLATRATAVVDAALAVAAETDAVRGTLLCAQLADAACAAAGALPLVYAAVLARPRCVTLRAAEQIFAYVEAAADVGGNHEAELDVDAMMRANARRAVALDVLRLWVRCAGAALAQHAEAVRRMLCFFVAYDPLGGSDAELDFDLEYSDGEHDPVEGDYNDALASRLRAAALETVLLLCATLGGVLWLCSAGVAQLAIARVADVPAVLAAAVEACVLLVERAADDELRALAPRLELALFALFAADCHLADRLLVALVARRALLSRLFLDLVETLFARGGWNPSAKPDLLAVYAAIVAAYPWDAVPPRLVERILADVALALPQTNYNPTALLLCCSAIVALGLDDWVNRCMFAPLAEKTTSKVYSADLRLQFLDAFCNLVVNVALLRDNCTRAHKVFEQCLALELAVGRTIHNLKAVLQGTANDFATEAFCTVVRNRATACLASSDSNLYMDSVKLLDVIIGRSEGNPADVEKVTELISTVIRYNIDDKLVSACLRIIANTLRVVTVDEARVRSLFDILNLKFSKGEFVDYASLHYFAEQLAAHAKMDVAHLFGLGRKCLVLSFVNARALAVIATLGRLKAEVAAAEAELRLAAAKPAPKDAIVFDIYFLGHMSVTADFCNVSYNDYLDIVKGSNETYSEAAALALGLLVTRDTATLFPQLLDDFRRTRQFLLLVSIRQVLLDQTLDAALLERTWECVTTTVVLEIGHPVKNVSSLKLAGDVLTEVARRGDFGEHLVKAFDPLLISLVYTAIVVVKLLMSDVCDLETVRLMVQYLPRPDLELKMAIVSTLLTGLHNQPEKMNQVLPMVMPFVYAELAPQEQFKKVIPMGPYKYIVDEGLEVRKMSFEILNALCLEEAHFQLEREELFGVLVAKGLTDKEIDILNCAFSVLVQLVQSRTPLSDRTLLAEALDRISLKRPAAKASAQEIESLEEMQRSMVRFVCALEGVYDKDALGPELTKSLENVRLAHNVLFATLK